jgi:hypothetical protein
MLLFKNDFSKTYNYYRNIFSALKDTNLEELANHDFRTTKIFLGRKSEEKRN